MRPRVPSPPAGKASLAELVAPSGMCDKQLRRLCQMGAFATAERVGRYGTWYVAAEEVARYLAGRDERMQRVRVLGGRAPKPSRRRENRREQRPMQEETTSRPEVQPAEVVTPGDWWTPERWAKAEPFTALKRCPQSARNREEYLRAMVETVEELEAIKKANEGRRLVGPRRNRPAVASGATSKETSNDAER